MSPEFPDQLLIALEPEAASIFVRRLRLSQLVPERPVAHALLLPASQLVHNHAADSAQDSDSNEPLSDQFQPGESIANELEVVLPICIMQIL